MQQLTATGIKSNETLMMCFIAWLCKPVKTLIDGSVNFQLLTLPSVPYGGLPCHGSGAYGLQGSRF